MNLLRQLVGAALAVVFAIYCIVIAMLLVTALVSQLWPALLLSAAVAGVVWRSWSGVDRTGTSGPIGLATHPPSKTNPLQGRPEACPKGTGTGGESEPQQGLTEAVGQRA